MNNYYIVRDLNVSTLDELFSELELHAFKDLDAEEKAYVCCDIVLVGKEKEKKKKTSFLYVEEYTLEGMMMAKPAW